MVPLSILQKNVAEGSEREPSSEEEDEEKSMADETEFILEEFKVWMKSPVGGNRYKKTAHQHKRQLAKIIEVVGGSAKDLLDVRILHTKFITQYCEKEQKYKPQTIQSYLMGIRHFLSFLIAEPTHLNYDSNDVLVLRERFERWSTA